MYCLYSYHVTCLVELFMLGCAYSSSNIVMSSYHNGVLAGTFFISLLGMLPEMFKELEVKQSVVIHTRFFIDNYSTCFEDQTFRIFHKG